MYYNPFSALKLEAVRAFGALGFRVLLDDEFEYDQAHEVSNSYFDLKPRAVAYPRTAKQVAMCIAYCKANQLPFRARSGGHHHEGMSSLNDGLVIRLSDMSLIDYCDDDFNEAWVDSGMKLGSVYTELAQNDRIIPAGGCFTVNVGGLALGGGWGMHSRMHGLTCDSLLAIELVLANGDVKQVTPKSDPELFRALCGAGQGNFGIVTRLKFRLTPLADNLTFFRLGWRADKREHAAKAWLDIQAQFPKELTTFLRMSMAEEGAPQPAGRSIDKIRAREYPIYGGGLFYGKKEELKDLPIFKKYLALAQPEKVEIQVVREEVDGYPMAGEKEAISIIDLFGYDDFTMELTGAVSVPEAGDDCKIPVPPAANCNVPHPHKVSSAFPNGQGGKYNTKIASSVAKYLNDSKFDPNVRSYMTFHAMGGMISKEPKAGRAFPYSEKEFLLQFQSWWNYPEDQSSAKGKQCMEKIRELEKPFIQWVKAFRESLNKEELVEGAFINFVDRDLPNSEGKTGLLEHYFAHNLNYLMDVKKQVDSEDQFNFEMSIPLPTN